MPIPRGRSRHVRARACVVSHDACVVSHDEPQAKREGAGPRTVLCEECYHRVCQRAPVCPQSVLHTHCVEETVGKIHLAGRLALIRGRLDVTSVLEDLCPRQIEVDDRRSVPEGVEILRMIYSEVWGL